MTSKSRDILSNPLSASVWFCLPVIAIVASAQHDVGLGLRTAVWTAALSMMGAACIVNAVRCGRMHCYITGPFFLMMAALSLLYGVGVIPLGANGWTAIGLTILFGAIALSCLPEMLFGKYRRGADQNVNNSGRLP